MSIPDNVKIDLNINAGDPGALADIKRQIAYNTRLVTQIVNAVPQLLNGIQLILNALPTPASEADRAAVLQAVTDLKSAIAPMKAALDAAAAGATVEAAASNVT